MKKSVLIFVIALVAFVIAGCTEADLASNNTSRAADSFEVDRRIVFYNGITGDYILTIEGRCALGNADPQGELSVTCKIAEGMYKKHFLGLSDNVTYFAEHLEPSAIDTYRYRVIFKPSAIIPDIDIQ